MSITANSYSADDKGGYENVDINTDAVTTTITDGDNDKTPNQPVDTVYARLVNDDTQAEGDLLTHKVELVDKDGHLVTVAEGETITVNLEYNKAGSDTATKDTDYTPTDSITISGGENSKAFTIPAIDDYFADNGEKYTINISSVTQANNSYENVAPANTDNGYSDNEDSVTGTITDGSNESDGGTGDSDTVYVQLYGDASKVEADGAELTHTLKLVDKDGNDVNLPSGESMTVNLTYDSSDTISDDDLQGGKVTTVTIDGDGGNTYTFSNIIKEDTADEGIEKYTVSIDSASSSYFENMKADSNDPDNGHYNQAIGEIREEVNPQDDSVELAEGGITKDNSTESMNLLDNDETGQNGKITKISYTDEDGNTQSADVPDDSNGVTVDTQYGSLTIKSNGEWSYTSDTTEDNNPNVSEVITYTLTDGDSNSNTADFTIKVDDTDPSATTVNDTLYEKNLSDGSDSDNSKLTVTNDFSITKGADDIADVKFDTTTTDALDNLNLTSHGTALSYEISNSNHTLTAKADDREIFTVTIKNPTDNTGDSQQYEFTLKDDLDHPDADGANSLVLPFNYRVLDTDSEVAGSAFNITIVDDTPQANSEDVLSVVEGGNTLSGTVNLMNNDVEGADDPLQMKSFKYQDEDGNWQDGAFGVDEDTQYGTLKVNSDGTWSYTSDDSEANESGTDANDTNDWVTDTFEYTVVDRDGDTSSATQDINVTDGANPTLNPSDGTVDEDDLFSNEYSKAKGNLDITKGSDDIADTRFTDDTIDNLKSLHLKSNGVELDYTLKTYTYNGDDRQRITATADRDGDGNSDLIFKMWLKSRTDASGEDQRYEFRLYQPLDHVDNGNNDDNSTDDPMNIPFSVYTVDTDNKNGVDGDDDATATFNVQVLDSVPTATDSTIHTTEDTSKTIRLSVDDFKDNIKITSTDNVEQSIAKDESADIYDKSGDDIIGHLTNNGDGTVTFTPVDDYSNYDYANSATSFDYTITDNDGDEASATVTVEVEPVADAPTISVSDISTTEDDDNTKEGSNEVSLGLTLPEKSGDDTDKNGSGDKGDHPESLGYIVLDFPNASDVSGAVVKAGGYSLTLDSDNDEIKVYINDQENYHYAGLDPNGDGVWSLTKDEYEAMSITPAEDNDKDIEVDIAVTSYEVDDDNKPLDTSNEQYNESDYETEMVRIQAKTDDVALKWDDDSRGSISTKDNSDDKYNFDSISEGDSDREIDLTLLLSKVSGYVNDTSGDLDGSEHRSYTVTGIPNGTIVEIDGSRGVATGGTTDNSLDASVTVKFPDNTKDDPSFKLTLPEQYGGKIKDATLQLDVYDQDSDTGNKDDTKSAKVYFDIDVAPVADDVTIQVAQPKGYEDDGRSQGNTANDSSAETIDEPENGIDIHVLASSDDRDGSETYNITVDQIPDGGAIYYSDGDGSILIGKDGAIDGSNSKVSSEDSDSSDGIWKLKIDDYDNSSTMKFVPPHNSDDDYTFHIEGVSVDHYDDGTVASTQLHPTTLDVYVQVDDVADIPINDALASVNVTDDDGDDNDFNASGTEDSGDISLANILATPNTIASYDQDGSEKLTIKITNLPDGFDIVGDGATFVAGSGTGRIWFVDPAEIDNVSLKSPQNFAGEVDFDMSLITTENAGDSKTHATRTVSVMITPEAEATVNNHDTQDEDKTITLDFSVNKPDSDGSDAGEEKLTQLGIKMNTVPDGVTLKDANGDELSDSGDGYAYITVNDGVPEDVTATLAEDDNMNGSYSFDYKYVISDVAVDNNGNTYTDTKEVSDTYTVDVNAITDDIDMTTETSTTSPDIDVDSGDAANVTIKGNGSFTKTIHIAGIDSDGRGNPDTDGSEKFTRIKVTGVPEGIEVGGDDGRYAGDTGAGDYSGVWYVDIDPDKVLDGSDVTYDLKFDADGDIASGDYDVKIISYNEDSNNGTEQNDSETFTISVPNDIDNGVTNPAPEIKAFYQDIDNDDTHDHDYVVTSDEDHNITDDDAYDNSILREDTPFALSDVIYVETDDTEGKFSITVTGLPDGVKIDGMTKHSDGDNSFYTYTGEGKQQDIVDALQSITVTPVSNENTDANDIDGTDLNFNVELTTYNDADDANTALINFTGSVMPVTDNMQLTVDGNDSTQEDTDYSFSITMDNDADGDRTQIVDGKVYLQLNENYTDTPVGDDGTAGVLKYEGNEITTQSVSGVDGIPDGDYYVISDVSYSDVLHFTYTPATNRDGSIEVKTLVKNIESEDWSSYDTEEVVSSKTFTFNVTPVEDGYTTFNASATGNEDELIPITISASDDDDSELLNSITLDKIPDGFTVYYGDDESSATLAQNVGVNGQMQMEMIYGQPETVDYNLWNIPTNDGEIPAYIAIKAPENWSGNIADVILGIVAKSGTQYSDTFDVTVNPVVDGVTFNPSKTFGNAGDDIEIKLNANVKDLDNSEKVTMTLDGLGEGAEFKIDGQKVDATYDSSNDEYTISNIAPLDINKVTVVQSAMSGTVDVSLKTTESDGTDSDVVTGSFDITIHESTPTSGDDTLLYDGTSDINGYDGDDTVLLKDGVNIDFAGTDTPLANIETIDLTSAGDHTLDNIAVADVKRMTDDDNQLVIKTDSGDSVKLTTEWSDAGSGVYQNDDGSVQVTVEGEGNVVNTATTIDGVISGIEYVTTSGLHGYTESDGTFDVMPGDKVTFMLGNIVVGEADPFSTGDGKVFLQDIAGVDRTDLNSTYVQNMAVLLQSLDSDGDASNGINISSSAVNALNGIDIDLRNTDTSDLISTLNNVGISTVDINSAMEHVKNMLVENTNLSMSDFGEIKTAETDNISDDKNNDKDEDLDKESDEKDKLTDDLESQKDDAKDNTDKQDDLDDTKESDETDNSKESDTAQDSIDSDDSSSDNDTVESDSNDTISQSDETDTAEDNSKESDTAQDSIDSDDSSSDNDTVESDSNDTISQSDETDTAEDNLEDTDTMESDSNNAVNDDINSESQDDSEPVMSMEDDAISMDALDSVDNTKAENNSDDTTTPDISEVIVDMPSDESQSDATDIVIDIPSSSDSSDTTTSSESVANSVSTDPTTSSDVDYAPASDPTVAVSVDENYDAQSA